MTDLKAKVTLLGDSEVGKTSLILRYVKNEFTAVYKATLGADFMTKKIEVEGRPDQRVTLAIWDLAGQADFNMLREYYLIGTLAAVLCFDLTNKTSFEHLPAWIEESRNICGDIPFVLVGTKGDLTDACHVKETDVTGFLEKLKMTRTQYYETSSATQVNVDQVFQHIIREYILKDIVS